MTLDDCAAALDALGAPLAAHSCRAVQVSGADIQRERVYLRGYQAALRDVGDHGPVIEAIDVALASIAAHRDKLRRSR